MGSLVKIAPAEGHEQIRIIERNNAQLRAAYENLSLQLKVITKENRLSISFCALNDVTSSVTGISPTTMVFGVYLKHPGSENRVNREKRAHITNQCTELFIKINFRRMIRDSSRPRSINSQEEMEKVRNLAPGKEALHRLYHAKFVDKVKLGCQKRSRLCIAACNHRTIVNLLLRLLSKGFLKGAHLREQKEGYFADN